ncbi:MAG: serine/threonine-protein kinase [Myxococcota bacterium]
MTASPALRTSFVSIRRLASGGMGSVELVIRRGDRFARPFVLKRSHFLDERSRMDLLDEARVAGLLSDPRIVPVVDVGEDADGPFLVMDYVDGASLAELISRLRARGDLIPVSVAAYIAEQTALALAVAHDSCSHTGEPLGIIHRDVSPQNILLAMDGGVRLTDFGIAKIRGRHSNTADGQLRGKAGYFAPEQVNLARVDHRADIFALGVVLAETLIQDRLFETVDRPRQLALDFFDYRVDVPSELEALVYDMLAYDRDGRPRSCKIVAERLRAFTDRPSHAQKSLSELLEREFGTRQQAIRRELGKSMETYSGSEEQIRSVSELAIDIEPAKTDDRAASSRSLRYVWPTLAVFLLCLAVAVVVGLWFRDNGGSGSSPPRADRAAPESELVKEAREPIHRRGPTSSPLRSKPADVAAKQGTASLKTADDAAQDHKKRRRPRKTRSGSKQKRRTSGPAAPSSKRSEDMERVGAGELQEPTKPRTWDWSTADGDQ